MLASLDGPLHALTLRDPDVLIPMAVRDGEVRSLLAFTDAARAEAHRVRLPADTRGDWQVATFAEDDWRGKEELLRAAGSAGASRVEIDADLDLRPRYELDLSKAIAYVSSYKRATACL